MDEALDHAVVLMTAEGVGALSVSEVARRMGIRGPSLYKYFPSRHAMYDALFARGLAEQLAAVRTAVDGLPRGVPRIRAGGAAASAGRWRTRPSPSCCTGGRCPASSPRPAVFAPSVDDMADVRAEFAEAVRLGQLRPAPTPTTSSACTPSSSPGSISQQLANQPGAAYAEGDFSRLTDTAIEQFLSAYAP